MFFFIILYIHIYIYIYILIFIIKSAITTCCIKEVTNSNTTTGMTNRHYHSQTIFSFKSDFLNIYTDEKENDV